MKGIIGFILFLLICSWLIRGCDSSGGKLIYEQNDPEQIDIDFAEDTTQIGCEDGCGGDDGEIINSDVYDDISYAIFMKGDKVLAVLGIQHETTCGQATLTFNEYDFTPNELNVLLNDYGFTSSSPACFKNVNIYDWDLPSFISIKMKYLRLTTNGKKVSIKEIR